jgi:hypothetical protein
MTSISKALREMKNNLKTDIEENFISATVATGQYGIDKKLLQTKVEEGLVETIKMWKKIFYRKTDIAFHIFWNWSK